MCTPYVYNRLCYNEQHPWGNSPYGNPFSLIRSVTPHVNRHNAQRRTPQSRFIEMRTNTCVSCYASLIIDIFKKPNTFFLQFISLALLIIRDVKRFFSVICEHRMLYNINC